jgi:prophage antirepressor-like protein
VFLDYQNPEQAVRHHVPPEARKQWDERDPAIRQRGPTPPYWKPNTVLISEGGLYRLFCRSTKREAIRFEKWVFDEVLPTLRETGTYQLEKLLEVKDQFIVKLQEKVAVMTERNKTRHVLQIYKHRTIPNEYLFIRTQRRNLHSAMKAVESDNYEIILHEVDVPNSTNILNRLKEKLMALNISFEASKNKLTVDANVLNMVRELLQEPWT